MVLDIDFQVVLGKDCPTLASKELFCLSDMKKHHLSLNVLTDEVKLFDRTQKLDPKNCLLAHRFSREDFDTYAGFTRTEAVQLHRAFGHAAPERLSKLLEDVDPNERSDIRAMLEEIRASCDVCQRHGVKPKRFKLHFGNDDCVFNGEIEMDVVYFEKMPVLHIVCTGTRYQAASFLTEMSTKHVWDTIRRIWIHCYLGPPDRISVDQGSNFVSEEFFSEAEQYNIAVQVAPIECPTGIPHVERYHGPLRAAYEKIRETEEDPELALQHAVFAVNSTCGPEGVVPSLLVFGSLPRPARRGPSVTQVQRAYAIEQAREKVTKLYKAMKVQVGLKYNGPYAGEREDLEKLRPGDHCLDYYYI